MSAIDKITYKEVERLDPIQLTNLLKRLLYLEAMKYDIPTPSIDVALNITVNDGGKDGSIEWKSGPQDTPNLPNRCTGFQCKAIDMPASKCKKEMFKATRTGEPISLKPAIKELFDKNGAYVLFYNRSTTKKGDESRISKMREALKDVSRTDSDTSIIQIYDVEKIANWVNENLPAVIFVLECCQISVPARIETWDSWSKNADMQGQYFPNAFLNDQAESIRKLFLKPQSIMRIKGHSGLGKTRLAFEAFRSPDDGDFQQTVLNISVLYYDSSMDDGGIRDFIANSYNRAKSGVLVIDNCDIELHNNLVGWITRTDSTLSLLTIDYGFEKTPPPTLEIEIKPDQLKDVVKSLIKAKYPSIGDSDLHRIEEFAKGFPKIAVLVAEARFSGSDRIGYLSDSLLLKRLLWRRGKEVDLEYRVIKACSIFKYIGIEKDVEEQAKFVANSVCNINYRDFYRICGRFMSNQMVMQQRGRFITISPTPLAITLAFEWWEEIPPSVIDSIITGACAEGLLEPLCEQIGLLSFSPRVQELAGYLLSSISPFGQAETLSTNAGSRVFLALAELDHKAAVDALYREFFSWSIESLLQIVDGRRNLIWALEKLCWWEDTFHKAASVMLLFAAAENETYGNNATNQFLQLFHLVLPGTTTPLLARLDVLEKALQSNEPKIQSLAVRGFGSSLSSGHFSRMDGAEMQGSRAPEPDYQPKTPQEIYEYRKSCLDRLGEIACGEDESLAELAKDEMANKLFGIIQEGTTYGIDYLSDIDRVIKEVVKQRGPYWPEAYDHLKQTLKWRHSLVSEVVREKIDEWISLLTPDNIKEKLGLIVSVPPWELEKDERGKYIDKARISAETLAEQLGNPDTVWCDLLPTLMNGEQRQGYNFGRKLAETMTNPNAFISDALNMLRSGTLDNPNPVILSGFLAGVTDRNVVSDILGIIFSDEHLLKHAVEITRLSSAPIKDLKRLINLVREGKIPVSELNGFTYNSVLSHLSSEEIISFCTDLGNLSDEGKACAFNILFMNSFHVVQMFDLSRDTFRKWILSGRLLVNGEEGVLDVYNWQEIVKKMLDSEVDDELALGIAEEIISNCEKRNFVSRDFLKEVVGILFSKYFSSVWSLFGSGLLSDYKYLKHNLAGFIGCESIFSIPGPMGNVPDEVILEWCADNQSTGLPVILDLVPLFDLSKLEVSKQTGLRNDAIYLESPDWYPLTREIIERYGQRKDIQESLVMKMTYFGWGGSPIQYYKQLITLLEKLSDSTNSIIKLWSTETIVQLNKLIEEQKNREDEDSIGAY